MNLFTRPFMRSGFSKFLTKIEFKEAIIVIRIHPKFFIFFSSTYRYLLLDIAMTLSGDDVDYMKYLAADKLHCATDSIKDIYDLLVQLEVKKCISADNVGGLCELITHHQQLTDKISQYEGTWTIFYK